MNWICAFGNNDSTLDNLTLLGNSALVSIRTWDGKIKELCFADFLALKIKNAIGEEIGDIDIRPHSLLKNEIEQDFDGELGSCEEHGDVKSIVFMNAWEDREILEIICDTKYITLK